MPKRWIRGLVALVAGLVVATPIALSAGPAAAGDPPVASIGDVTIRDGLKATRTMRFNVSLSKPAPEGGAQVSFVTIDGTAGPDDYAPRIGILEFAQGDRYKTIDVQVAANTLNEATEFFGLNIFDPVGVTIGRHLATGTLIDDLPHTGREISIGDASIVQSREGKIYVHLSVTMSKPALRSVDVKYATHNGTAVSGKNGAGDYQARTGTLRIDQGQTSRAIRIALRPLPEDGVNRFFTVSIGEPSRYRIGDSSGSVFILVA